MSLGSFLKKTVAPIGGAAIGFALGGPAGAAAGFEVGSSVGAALDTRKASKDQARIQALLQRRQVIQQIREARSTKANAETNAANVGASDSSSAILGPTSIGTQLSSNIGFLNQTGALSSDMSSLLNEAQTFQTIGSVAGSLGQQFTTYQKTIQTADAAGIPRDQVSSGTIFDIF